MLIKKAADLRESDVTPKELFLKRREFLTVAGSAAVAVAGTALAPVVTGTPTASATGKGAPRSASQARSGRPLACCRSHRSPSRQRSTASTGVPARAKARLQSPRPQPKSSTQREPARATSTGARSTNS